MGIARQIFTVKKASFFVGILVFSVVLFGGVSKVYAAFPDPAYEGYWWNPNHGNSTANGSLYNLISDDAYMQLAISRDGYTDILDTTLKIYSTDPYISVEVFGADLCTGQPSYTTDEFFGSNSRSDMYTSFSVGPADDELAANSTLGRTTGRIGVYAKSGVTRASAKTYGNYKGSSCDATNARRYMTARSNIYDETLGKYVFNFTAAVGSTAPSGFINGFRVRALRSTSYTSGIVVSQDPGLTADHFGIEAGYPRGDRGNPGSSSAYPNLAFPFVPDCETATGTTKTVSIYDDDNGDSSIQPTKFQVKLQTTNGADADIPFDKGISFTKAGGTWSGPDASGYYTVTGGSKNTAQLKFTMNATQSYVLRILNLYQNNTLQVSLPSTTSPVARNCPKPASLDGVKMDDATGIAPYGGGNWSGQAFSAMGVKVAAATSTANPFDFTNAVKVTSLSGTYATISLTTAIPTGYVLRGHIICESSATCNTTLANPANAIGAGATSFSHKFESGKRYSMRWIFSRVVGTICSKPPLFDPSFPEPSVPFSLTTGMIYSNSTYAPVNPRIALTIRNTSNVAVYGPITQTPTQSGANTRTTFTGINLGATAAKYTATWQYTDSTSSPPACTYDFYVGNKPYFQVWGGDIWSGGGGDIGGLQSWNNNNKPPYSNGWPNYTGARTDFAALASGEIRDFGTGWKGYLGAWNPKTYALSNDTATGATDLSQDLYGGSLDAVPPRTNYYENLIDYPAIIDHCSLMGDPIAVNVGTLSTGIHKYCGNLKVYGNVAVGRDVTILTPGYVILSNLGGTKVGYAAYTTFDQIPRLNIFTGQDGNIYVGSGVNEIHGLFSTGPNGNFYSCAIETTPVTPVNYENTGTYFAQCNTQLKIYGSVQADQMVLSRTYSSLRSATSNPAEVFIYSPEAWIALPRSTTTSGSVDFNSYLGLPPVL